MNFVTFCNSYNSPSRTCLKTISIAGALSAVSFVAFTALFFYSYSHQSALLNVWRFSATTSGCAVILSLCVGFGIIKYCSKKEIKQEPLWIVKKKITQLVLKEINPQKESSLFCLPIEMIVTIISLLHSSQELLTVKRSCKRGYQILYEKDSVRLDLLKRMNAKKNLKEIVGYCILNNLRYAEIEIPKIQHRLNSDSIQYLGGIAKIVFLPTTTFFSDIELTAASFMNKFALVGNQETKKNVYRNRKKAFNGHPMVRGYDKNGTLFILAGGKDDENSTTTCGIVIAEDPSQNLCYSTGPKKLIKYCLPYTVEELSANGLTLNDLD